MRRQFVWSVAIVLLVIAIVSVFYRPILWSLALIGPLIVLGFRDFWQPDRMMAQTVQFK